MISVLLVPTSEGKDAVGVVLGPGDVFLTTDGTPQSGVALSPGKARLIAQRLLETAEEVERRGNFLQE